nr:hypothetical protein [uncultured Draconibacterium sp.]
MDKKAVIQSITKSAFGIIPYAGTALNELVFDYNGRIKQKRLNRFIEILAEYFNENNDVNLDNIKTEDFNDLFEAVLRRVVTTKSELKLERFKNIIIKELKTPTKETELIDLYLDLISSLSEEEINILYQHIDFDKSFEVESNKLGKLKEELEKVTENKKKESIIIGRSKYEDSETILKNQIKEIEDKRAKLQDKRKAEFYGLDEQRFIFFKQRLYSKGLLIDNGIGKFGYEPFLFMGITEFGLEFIEFIKSNEKNCR